MVMPSNIHDKKAWALYYADRLDAIISGLTTENKYQLYSAKQVLKNLIENVEGIKYVEN